MTASIGTWLGWVAVLAVAQGQDQSVADKVRLAVSAEAVLVHEKMPVSLRLEIYNLTAEPLRVGFVLKPVFQNWVEVFYRRVPGDFQRLAYTPEWDPDGPGRDHPDVQLFAIDAHGVSTFPFSIAADPSRNSFLFDSPGEYELKVLAHRALGSRPIETPPLRIQVQPAPPSEAAALEDWDVGLALFAQDDGSEGGPHFRREATRALRFMDTHPSSLYARVLRQRTYDTLRRLQREGATLSDYEEEAVERLGHALREPR